MSEKQFTACGLPSSSIEPELCGEIYPGEDPYTRSCTRPKGHLGAHRDDVSRGGCTMQWPPEHSEPKTSEPKTSEPKTSEPPRWGYDEDTQFKPLNDAARVADLSLENRAYKNAQKMLVQTATQQVEEAYLPRPERLQKKFLARDFLTALLRSRSSTLNRKRHRCATWLCSCGC
jgi:hypothetical protein